MSYKTGISDKDVVDDTLQEFYHRLITTKALETYDEQRGAFETYIMNLFCWMLTTLARHNFRYNHEVTSTVVITNQNFATEENDVWDHVKGRSAFTIDFTSRALEKRKEKKHSSFKDAFEEDKHKYEKERGVNVASARAFSGSVDARFLASAIDREEELSLHRDITQFLSYVRRTEPPVRSSKIIKYVRYKMMGFNNSDIATMLRVSNTMVGVVRKLSWDLYNCWRGYDNG